MEPCIVTPRVKRTQAPPPKTSKWPYPDPTPGGTPTCTERFPIMLVHTIVAERLGKSGKKEE